MKAVLIAFPAPKDFKNSENFKNLRSSEKSRAALEIALASARAVILELEHENLDLRSLCADLALENKLLEAPKRIDRATVGRSATATTAKG